MSEPVPGAQTYKRLLGYVKPYWKVFAIGVLCNAAYGYIDTEFVKAFEPLLDEALIDKNLDFLTIAPLFVIVIMLIRGVVGFIANYTMAWVSNNVVMTLRKELFARYMMMPASYFDKHHTGELLSKVTYNTEQLARSSTDAITNIVRNVAFIIFALLTMFLESWKLTLLFLITGPVIAILVSVTSKRFRLISKKIQSAMGNITHVTQEGVESYRDIKIYGGQTHEQAAFDKVNSTNRQLAMKMEVTKSLSVPIIQMLAALGLALVLYFAVKEVINETITPGGFVTMLMLMMLMLKPLKSLTTVNAVLQRGIAAAESIFEVIDHEAEVDKGTQTLTKPKGHIQLENVVFHYPNAEAPALNKVSMDLPAGKVIALVGRSGSGKSTITSLLLRFYNHQQGKITLDGVDVEDIKLENYRKHFALVSQQITLFNDSIANNIAYGSLGDSVDRDAIIDAAKKAHAWEFIEKLPNGLDTMIGERGMLLSGGQRQRLAIARAILKDAPVLILDEATSALDTESEKYIQQAMSEVMQNRTTLVIAHRLSTIESADCILVMDNGQIKEQGTHQELLAQKGIYSALHQMQFQE
jgi:ATP-binding cassette, subfamily B, bacterial MsbA